MSVVGSSKVIVMKVIKVIVISHYFFFKSFSDTLSILPEDKHKSAPMVLYRSRFSILNLGRSKGGAQDARQAAPNRWREEYKRDYTQ